MKVGWLSDPSEYTGGAELTQKAFRDAAPEGVEIVDWRTEADRYVVHNHMTFGAVDLPGKVIRYHHDTRPQFIEADVDIYCSPLQREHVGGDGPVIPPPVDLRAFAPTRQQRRNAKRQGAVCIGAFMNPGKGGHLVSEWADENEPVDVWGFGPYQPAGPNIRNRGALEQSQIPTVLWGAERFVFLPTALEPFGRCVAEAHAAGCEIVTNQLVGARYWLELEPEKLDTAASDFWAVVCD